MNIKAMEQKLDELNAQERMMLSLNESWRNKAPYLITDGVDLDVLIRSQKEGVPPYSQADLINCRREILCCKKLLENAHRNCEMVASGQVQDCHRETYSAVHDVETLRIVISFPAGTTPRIRQVLKYNGFTFSRVSKSWFRYLDANGEKALQEVVSRLDRMGVA